jgi:hypothetical protein
MNGVFSICLLALPTIMAIAPDADAQRGKGFNPGDPTENRKQKTASQRLAPVYEPFSGDKCFSRNFSIAS